MLRSAKTAVLFFTHSAHREAADKLFCDSSDARKNLSIASALIHRTEKEIRKSGLPYFKITSHKQQGNTFGERLSSAFAFVFARGFDHVIAIGNDCPSLSSADLRAAAAKLQSCAAVLGPANDGGAYLIGFRRHDFYMQEFLAIHWNKESVYEELLSYCSSKNIVSHSLHTKADIDSARDVKMYLLHFFHVSRFLQYIDQLIIEYAKIFIQYKFSLMSARFICTRPLRSPAYIA